MPPWLRRFLLGLESVDVRPSRVGDARGDAGFAGGREFVHLHAAPEGELWIDLRLPPAIQRECVDDPAAIRRPRRSAWMEYRLVGTQGRARAKELIRLAHADVLGD